MHSCKPRAVTHTTHACTRTLAGSLALDPSFPAAWLSALPKLLWELGPSSPPTTALALSMLHDAARLCAPPQPHPPAEARAAAAPGHAAGPGRSPAGSGGPAGGGAPGQHGAQGWTAGAAGRGGALHAHVAAVLSGLQPQLGPLFAVPLPGGGAGAAGAGGGAGAAGGAGGGAGAGGQQQQQQRGGGLLPGPVTQLGPGVQDLAVDCVHHLLAGACVKLYACACACGCVCARARVRFGPCIHREAWHSLLGPPGSHEPKAKPTLQMGAGGVVDTGLLRALLGTVHAGLLAPTAAQRCVEVRGGRRRWRGVGEGVGRTGRLA